MECIDRGRLLRLKLLRRRKGFYHCQRGRLLDMIVIDISCG